MTGRFSEKHIGILKELLNIGVGKGGEVLNQMLSAHIQLDVPEIIVAEEHAHSMLLERESDPLLAAVNMDFDGNLNGTVDLMFRTADADKLVKLITGADDLSAGMEMESLRTGTLMEIGNVVINGVIGSLSNILGLQLHYSVPNYLEGNIEQIIEGVGIDPEKSVLVIARTRFRAESMDLEGDLIFFLGIADFNAMVEAFEGRYGV